MYGCLTIKSFGFSCFLVGLVLGVFFAVHILFFISTCKLLFTMLQIILGSSVEYMNK